MKKKQVLLVNLAIAVFFAIIFYGNYIGINLLLFELVAIPIMLYINRPVKYNILTKTILGSVLLSAVMVVLLNTSWSIFINIFLLFTLSTTLSYKGFRSFVHTLLESFFKLFTSQFSIFLDWQEAKTERKQSNFSFRKLFYLVIIPLLIFILFIILYSSASTVFYQKFEGIFNAISRFFESINFVFILMIILGLIIGNILFLKTNPVGIYEIDLDGNDNLLRKRVKHYSPFKLTGLKLQNLSGIILLISLNILVFYFNVLDVINIWFGFQWDGGVLREFVHEGTWVLVFSIFISAAIALYFFRGNLNFFSKNKLLKSLTILWLSQNLIMTVSVIIRNYWYINYFGLAYKRIAVLFFLLLTIIGLITIILKILNKKSSFFLWRTNSFALVLVLVFSTCINWDVQIAKFNFKNYDRSLLDYKFLAHLSSSALPYTLKDIDELETINETQKKVIPFDINRGYLWDIYEYHDEIILNKERFLKRYSHMNFLEWNLADHQTYKKIKY